MTPEQAAREKSLGGVFVFSAYVLWGFLPLYFVSLAPTTPWEVVGWRILLSLVFCIALLAITRGWGRMRVILRDRRLMLWTLLAGLLIYVNWQVFLIGTLTGHVVETSLGYFINPIATVLLGVIVLKERLRTAQWVAVGIAGVAVVVIIVAVGRVPWIALALAASFATYGLVKKKIGPSVDAVSGLTLESFWLVPIAVLQLVLVGVTSGLTMGREGTGHTVLLLLAGAVTAVPLLFFSAGARRTTLTVVGILQFIAPIMQFLTGVLILGEPMPFERWIGFGLVWVAVAVFTVDSLLSSRRNRTRAEALVPDPV
ncbi:EamA family transporter RarD [Microbacterium sp. CnD16-F]|uniref:EamA family transporter RarD n=1 Tax=Microbacterium TaxID=33882 RepID=UPI002096D1D1|nr:EamA family transporter RarD [Microbacterium sp. CnD16-F]MCO7203598.1 EamA family transporter RarD [Microbacterium sp. CnD16-F]